MAIMNIQIFGTKKCNDTKKAQRYFKERSIKFQFIDMSEKEEKLLLIFNVPSSKNGFNLYRSLTLSIFMFVMI